MKPPKELQAANMPLLRNESLRLDLFDALERHDGVITKACRAIGIPFMTLHRERLRDKTFALQVEALVQEIRLRRSEELLASAQNHLRAHLDGPDAWEVVRDEETGEVVYETDPITGELQLDADFEPIPLRRSKVSLKGTIEAHREMRSTVQGDDQGARVAVQVNAQVNVTLPAKPVLVPGSSLDDLDGLGIEDAEFEDLEPHGVIQEPGDTPDTEAEA